MIRPGKKCICKKCSDCNFYISWVESNQGRERVVDRCGFGVLFTEIPKVRGSIDGLQGGVNQARNQAIVTEKTVADNTVKFVKSLQAMVNHIKRIGGNGTDGTSKTPIEG